MHLVSSLVAISIKVWGSKKNSVGSCKRACFLSFFYLVAMGLGLLLPFESGFFSIVVDDY
jgi:hypothetical protein